MTGATYTDNLAAVLRPYQAAQRAPRDHLLTMINRALYATLLHERAGAYVFNDALLIRVCSARMAARIEAATREGRLVGARDIILALRDASDDYIEQLQGFAGTMRPPATMGGPPRPEHGPAGAGMGWADVTTELAASFRRMIDGAGTKSYAYSGRVFGDR